jgi:glycosyltransferase involved in cell wall biosynthesis
MMECKIIVLMSTYNGERYLREQIDSILAQRGVNVCLLVRDDGSIDGTLNILNEYQSAGKLTFYTGANLGPQLSFMHLLQHATDSDYYAFADQDDYWMDDKLLSAINSLNEKENVPALYFSQTQLVNERLEPIKSVIINPLMTFGEALIYKFVGGCTMVMNHELRKAISNRLPSRMPMHDIWIYTMAMAINAFVYFDKTPHILYRQHGDNAVGQGQGFLYDWKLRLKRLLSNSNERYTQAKGLLDCYKNIIPKENLKLLTTFVDGKSSFRKRMSILLDNRFRCSDTTTQVLFWINLLLNKY